MRRSASRPHRAHLAPVRAVRALSRFAVCASPFLLTAAALAQRAQGPRSPKLDTAPSPVIGYAILAILAAIILAISLYPSKRAHTDL